LNHIALNPAPLSLKPSLRVTMTLRDFGQRHINGASILVDRTRSKQLPYQPKWAVFLRNLLGHDFFIGKARLWLAERAKSRGSHGGAPETGLKPHSLNSSPHNYNPQPSTLISGESRGSSGDWP